MFVYSIDDITRNLQSTSATQGGTRLYTEGLSRLNCCHTRRTAVDNRTGLTLWTLTRWRDQHTSDKVAHCSIYRPRKDERLSWPSWLTYSGRLTHISGHPSAAGRAWDRESTPVKNQGSATVPRSAFDFTTCFSALAAMRTDPSTISLHQKIYVVLVGTKNTWFSVRGGISLTRAVDVAD